MYTHIDIMSADDSYAISWLQNKKELEYYNAVINTNYDKCCKELVDMKIESDIITEKLLTVCKNNIKEKIKINKFLEKSYELFYEKYKDCFDKELSKEEFQKELDNLFKREENEYSLEQKELIIKLNRFYNMFLKLGHTAKIVYIADYISQPQEKDNKEENKEVVNFCRQIILASALMHDIGRFYQAIHYDDLVDSIMKENEDKIISPAYGNKEIEVDHSVAGYYYSMASSLTFQNLAREDSIDEVKRKFIIDAIAATVVRFHSLSNSETKHFECQLSLKDISNNTESDLINYMQSFITNAYNVAKEKNYIISPNLSTDFKQFVDEVLKKVKEKILLDEREKYEVADGFYINNEKNNQIYKSLEKGIKDAINNNPNSTFNSEQVVTEIVEVIHNVLEKNSINKEQISDALENIKIEIKEMLEGMLDYDIATTIELIMRQSFLRGEKLDERLSYIMSSSMTGVQDADKIDILNQRAIGIYNTSYYLNEVSIFPPENKSFIEIINDYFYFNIKPNENGVIVLDEKILKIINNMSGIAKKTIKKYLQVQNESEIPDFSNISKIEIQNNVTNLYLKPDNYKVTYNNSSYWDLFCKDTLIELLVNNLTEDKSFYNKILNNKDFNTLKGQTIEVEGVRKKCYQLLNFSIDRKDLEKNIETYIIKLNPTITNQDLIKEKVIYFKRLLLGEETNTEEKYIENQEPTTLTDRFKLLGENPVGMGWILKLENHHVMSSGITALIWHLNQFIHKNLRNKRSFEFIKENLILEKILAQYKEKDAIIYELLKEYINYSKEFINYVLESNAPDLLTDELMEQYRKDFFIKQKEKRL